MRMQAEHEENPLSCLSAIWQKQLKQLWDISILSYLPIKMSKRATAMWWKMPTLQ